MSDKYLTESELENFIEWCKKSKVTQKEVAEISGVHEQWVSKVFAARRLKRNKNFRGDLNKIKKFPFERARARLVLLTKKEEMLKNFIDL